MNVFICWNLTSNELFTEKLLLMFPEELISNFSGCLLGWKEFLHCSSFSQIFCLSLLSDKFLQAFFYESWLHHVPIYPEFEVMYMCEGHKSSSLLILPSTWEHLDDFHTLTKPYKWSFDKHIWPDVIK